MDKKDKRSLVKCRSKLVINLDVKPVLDHLFEAGILTADQVERILCNDTSGRKNRAFLDILPMRGPTAFNCFIDALTNTGQCHLSRFLISNKQDYSTDASSPGSLAESVNELNINDNPEDESSRTPFLQLQLKEKLEEFFIRVVQPDSEFVSRCNYAIDLVSKTFIREFNNCSKIFVGGSLGKETDVRSFSDVDMLLELNDVKSVADLAGSIDDILTVLAGHLVKFTDKHVELSVQGKTKYAIQFNIKERKDKEWIKVDLLPIVNVWNNYNADAKANLEAIYKEMNQADDVSLDLYSKCLSKLQIDFIKESPSVIKDVIRLLKYWNHTEWIGLTSTCIEMIVVHEFRNDVTSRRFYFVDLLCAAVRSICVYSELKITWTDYYSPQNYNSIHSSQPVILDPTNPFNNLHPGDNNPRKYNLQRIQCEATKLLARIMKHLPRI